MDTGKDKTNFNEINRENFPIMMAAFMEQNELSVQHIAGAIGCSGASLNRILASSTRASDDMLRQGALLMGLGFDRFSKLTDAEREKLSEALGAIGGGVLGFAAVMAAVEGLGVVGLSAAGITSGLAAIGALVGGGMAAGVAAAAAIPIAAMGIGYGIIRAVKYFVSDVQLKADKLDPKWEIPPDNQLKIS